MNSEAFKLQLVLITGMSGSGKSVALHALEDSGYFCVDNLPPELLVPFVELKRQQNATKVAIAVDARNGSSLHLLPQRLSMLRAQGIAIKSLFLDAGTGTLVRRFSETRRMHPLSQNLPSLPHDQRRALVEAIEMERDLLMALREQAHIIDTSILRSSQLQSCVKSLIAASHDLLTLVFESFAFKRGVPSDADFVFDVRMLPNPYYEPDLRKLNGQDAAVAAFLSQHSDVTEMCQQIFDFLQHWLEALARDHRSYVTVAVGCTGGQHRSVYLVEQLVERFQDRWVTLKFHRELEAH